MRGKAHSSSESKTNQPKILYFIMNNFSGKQYWVGPWFKYPTNQLKKNPGQVVTYSLDENNNYIKTNNNEQR
jgi:hypothetical protein